MPICKFIANRPEAKKGSFHFTSGTRTNNFLDIFIYFKSFKIIL